MAADSDNEADKELIELQATTLMACVVDAARAFCVEQGDLPCVACFSLARRCVPAFLRSAGRRIDFQAGVNPTEFAEVLENAFRYAAEHGRMEADEAEAAANTNMPTTSDTKH